MADAEDELHGLSKIIDVKPQKSGSVRISVAALLLSEDTSELSAAGFSGSRMVTCVAILRIRRTIILMVTIFG